MEDVLYTVPELSELLKTKPGYVYQLIRLGYLPALKLGRIKVTKKALREFLQKYEGYDLTDLKKVVPLNEVVFASNKSPGPNKT